MECNTMQVNNETKLKKFGKNLADIRKRIGITQEELAFKSEIDRSYISGIESGHRNVAVINILKLAEALNTDPGSLFDGMYYSSINDKR
jgi:transcriptional regulator with XRE-family HTH domain